MSMFESGASCDGHAMFSADSGPKSHACAPRSCQSKQFSQVECAGSSGCKTSPVLEGRAKTKEKLFCQARGCLSEQDARSASSTKQLGSAKMRCAPACPRADVWSAPGSLQGTQVLNIGALGPSRARQTTPARDCPREATHSS